MEEVMTFESESMYSVTWEKDSDVIAPKDSNLMSAREIAYTTNGCQRRRQGQASHLRAKEYLPHAMPGINGRIKEAG